MNSFAIEEKSGDDGNVGQKRMGWFARRRQAKLQRQAQAAREALALKEEQDRTAAKEHAEQQLHAAAAKGDLAQMGDLLARGVDCNVAKGRGTPLHAAAQEYQLEAAKLLIKHGANVNALQSGKYTPLDFAALFGDTSRDAAPMLKLLIECGADAEHTIQSGIRAATEFQDQCNSRIATGASVGLPLQAILSNVPHAYAQDFRKQNLMTIRKFLAGRSDAVSDLKALIVFKVGARPPSEIWYVHEVLAAVGFSIKLHYGLPVTVQYVPFGMLTDDYLMGYLIASEYDAEKCTRTPFKDRDGGEGIVIKIKA